MEKKQNFILGKMQQRAFCISTNKYDNLLPIILTENRPDGILKQLVNMMRNDIDINTINNFIQPYIINK